MVNFLEKFVGFIYLPGLYHRLRVSLRSVVLRMRGDNLYRYPDRRDVTTYIIQPQVELVVFWKVLAIGKGPALSLYVCGEEVLKFDCFGPDKGHFHISFSSPVRTTEDRLCFFEQTASEQIDRTLFELENNLHYCLQRHQRRRIRNIKVDKKPLADSCIAAGARMREFLNDVHELQDL
jgi:hypothetical protein